MITRYIFLLGLVLLFLASCRAPEKIHGLWIGTGDFGSIEFKSSGEVIIVDNMSANLRGRYQIEEDNLVTFEITASDILRESIQPTTTSRVSARIIRLDDEELHLLFLGGEKVELFRHQK